MFQVHRTARHGADCKLPALRLPASDASMSLSRPRLVRRDLRVSDHAALAAALGSCRRVHCVFVYDLPILDELRAAGLAADRRVEFIHAAVARSTTRCARAAAG